MRTRERYSSVALPISELMGYCPSEIGLDGTIITSWRLYFFSSARSIFPYAILSGFWISMRTMPRSLPMLSMRETVGREMPSASQISFCPSPS